MACAVSGPNPFRLFFWGHLKSKVHKTPLESIEDLKNRITPECKGISGQTLANVREEFENRLFYCLANNGAYFEHLIK